MFALLTLWTSCWIKSRATGDLRRPKMQHITTNIHKFVLHGLGWLYQRILAVLDARDFIICILPFYFTGTEASIIIRIWRCHRPLSQFQRHFEMKATPPLANQIVTGSDSSGHEYRALGCVSKVTRKDVEKSTCTKSAAKHSKWVQFNDFLEWEVTQYATRLESIPF